MSDAVLEYAALGLTTKSLVRQCLCVCVCVCVVLF